MDGSRLTAAGTTSAALAAATQSYVASSGFGRTTGTEFPKLLVVSDGTRAYEFHGRPAHSQALGARLEDSPVPRLRATVSTTRKLRPGPGISQ